jgi:hypothetical protein
MHLNSLVYMPTLWFVWISMGTLSGPAGLGAGVKELSPSSSPEEVVGLALKAWSQFTSRGELAVLDGLFLPKGPQYEQLAGEVPAGDPRLMFRAEEMVVRSADATSATVWVRVQVTREGHTPEVQEWDFDLVLIEEGWRVWTVVPAQRPVEIAPSSLAPTASDGIVPSRTQARESAAPIAASTSSNSTPGVRLPALSAWIIVVTIAGVALAGYLAPRIDRRREP